MSSPLFRKGRITAATRRRLKLREEFWPELTEDSFWNRKSFTGFTTIPRTLPLIMVIIDNMEDKNASRVYFDLWCRSFDDYMIEIKDESAAAYSSGYQGQRATRSWRERVDLLKTYGFLKIHYGPNGSYRYIALLDPHPVIDKLNGRGLVDREAYQTYRTQLIEIGAIQ